MGRMDKAYHHQLTPLIYIHAGEAQRAHHLPDRMGMPLTSVHNASVTPMLAHPTFIIFR